MSRPISKNSLGQRNAGQNSVKTSPTLEAASDHKPSALPPGSPVPVPPELIEKLGLQRGDRISVSFENHVMLVHDAKGRLLGRVTPEAKTSRTQAVQVAEDSQSSASSPY